jgi:hypothetical protein
MFPGQLAEQAFAHVIEDIKSRPRIATAIQWETAEADGCLGQLLRDYNVRGLLWRRCAAGKR